MDAKMKKLLVSLAKEMEKRAAKYGNAAAQPLGIRIGPPGSRSTHTRHNRAVLEGLCGGLNEAADLLRVRAGDRR